MERNRRGQKVLWQDMTRPDFEEAIREGAVVVLPVGSTEQHGPHLPVSVDIDNAYHLALEAAKRAEGFRVVVAPPMWSGFSPHHMGFPGTITLSLWTFQHMIMEVCQSIHKHGFRKVFILNGHGGNTAAINAAIQQLVPDGVCVALTTWWHLIPEVLREVGESPIGGMGHACEAETSMQMLLQPEAMDASARVKEIHSPVMPMARSDFRESGPVVLGLDFKRQSKHGVSGDPTLATEEKGRLILEATVNQLLVALGQYRDAEY